MAGRMISLSALVERHHPQMPRYLVVPDSVVAQWRLDGTTVVEGTINGTAMGRRTLKRWDEKRWFIDLPERLCRKVSVDTGDRVSLKISIASTELPMELAGLLSESSAARKKWSRLTPSRQRMVREQVTAAKSSGTRERRARRALGLHDEA